MAPAAIQWVLLPNFDCVICQEEHDGEGPQDFGFPFGDSKTCAGG